MGFYENHKKWIIILAVFLFVIFVLFLSLGLAGVFDGENTSENPPQARIECFPDRPSITETECESHGCIFDSTTYGNKFVPKCYRNPERNGFFKLKKVDSPPGTNGELFDLLPPSGEKVNKLYSDAFVRPQLFLNRITSKILQMRVRRIINMMKGFVK